jgi:TetR/AcrR family transcriptional regulator, tetracycline repressor protein
VPVAPGRQSRADKPALSREAIVEAALRIIDAEGVDAVSMRRVAQEFETGAASLYAYVTSKDQLLDLVLDGVMGQIAAAVPADGARYENWQEWLKESARAVRDVLTGHRDVAKVFLGRIPFGPNGLIVIEHQLAMLRAGGVPDRVAAFAGDLLSQYIVSTAIEEDMWRSRFPNATPQDIVAQMGEIRDYLTGLPVDFFPNVVAMAGPMMAGDSHADRFEMGLDIIVRGLASLPE